MAIKYRHNMMDVGSVATFARVRGGYSQGNRDVYFLRVIGGTDTLKREIQEIDMLLSAAMDRQQLLYRRLTALPLDMQGAERAYYVSAYEEWVASGGTSVQLHAEHDNEEFCKALGDALKTVGAAYDRFKVSNTDSIKRNFIIKLMLWTDWIMKDNPLPWNERSCIKIIADNVEKTQEYLFYYMLTLIGADVMLLQTKKDIEVPDWMEAYSKKLALGAFGDWEIPAYVHPAPAQQEKSRIKVVAASQNPSGSPQERPGMVQVSIPQRVRKATHPTQTNQPTQTAPQTVVSRDSSERKEKSFEELADLASSVVMITIHDQQGETMGTGSGIMIGKDGYILTNYHVVRGGRFYSISIEDDEGVYRTDELIKYHSVEDLAIIRIPRKLKPLPIYRGSTKLVRGQRVVAIGSPLGLFNSVSDGIISGFRKIDSVDMLQFTAPTSPGSSGGAILNMYGEVIGISTAGVDRGQNINLAVLYETILPFIHGFC